MILEIIQWTSMVLLVIFGIIDFIMTGALFIYGIFSMVAGIMAAFCDRETSAKNEQGVEKMLEKYEPGFDEEKFIKAYAVKQGINRKQAMAELRRRIPGESYYQDKVKRALKVRYPGAFIRKISQGAYSEGGMPDIMMIYKGHYFGFEIKRPVVGAPSKLQEVAVRQIQEAGGTAAFIRWPEEAIETVNNWMDNPEKGGAEYGK